MASSASGMPKYGVSLLPHTASVRLPSSSTPAAQASTSAPCGVRRSSCTVQA